jgi:DNA-binding NtrC family response regulator
MVKMGAYQYLTKPIENREMLQAVEEALECSKGQREQARLRREKSAPPPRIIGASRPMQELFDQIALAAGSASTVLIYGESGTGKELVGRAIHEMSERKGAFVPVNCSAIPAELIESELFGHLGGAFTGAKQSRAGLIESSDGGTLFLDEIGELPLSVQPKLLRSLQEGAVRRVGANAEKSVDLRVVAATNRNLEQDVRDGRFREDLYWRLNVIRLVIPPLRERPFDIPLLVEYFVNKATGSAKRPPLGVSSEALAILTAYSWPGNVRELENCIARALALRNGPVIGLADLPDSLCSMQVSPTTASALPDVTHLEHLERVTIERVFTQVKGDKQLARKMLGISRATLYRKLKRYNIGALRMPSVMN